MYHEEMHQLKRFQLQNVYVCSVPCSDVISLIKLLVWREESLAGLGVGFFLRSPSSPGIQWSSFLLSGWFCKVI